MSSSMSLLRISILLILIGMVGTFAADMYAPALPVIATALKTSHKWSRLSLSFYFLSYAILPLLYGPLADRYGRRPILLIGMVITCLGTIICALAANIALLILGRIVQGSGAAASGVLSRTLARDLMHGKQLAHTNSYISMFFLFAPIIAPAIGGSLEMHFGWRSIFWALLILIAILTITLTYVLPETMHHKPQKLHVKTIVRKYLELMTRPHFLGNALCSGMALSGILVYYTLAPFLFQHTFGFTTQQFGFLSAVVLVTAFGGRFLNTIWIEKIGMLHTMRRGIWLMLIGGASMLTSAYWSNVWAIVLPLIIFLTGTGMIYNNATAAALTPFGRIAGKASAVYSFIQLLAGGCMSGIASHLSADTGLSLALLLTGAAVIALLAFYYLVGGTQTEHTLVSDD